MNPWPKRAFLVAAVAVVILVVGNNVLILASSPLTWNAADPVISEETITFTKIFSTNPGDRLVIDLGQLLFQIGAFDMGSYRAWLYETPAGDRKPALDTPMFSAAGQPTGASFPTYAYEPAAPQWRATASSWLTLVVEIDHRGTAPQDADGREWYGRYWDEKFQGPGPLGFAAGPVQSVSAFALGLQPWLLGLQVLALAGMAGSGAMLLRAPREEEGLAGRLSAARQAENWLRQVRDQLLLSGLGLLLLALLLYVTTWPSGVSVPVLQQPDAFYNARASGLLGVTVAAVAAAWGVMLSRVQRRIKRIPELEFDA